jgi:hypothetical protein
MKAIILIFLSFLLSQNIYGQKLSIKVYNKTGYNLDSVAVEKVYVGLIKADSSVTVLNCKEFYSQDGTPFNSVIWIIKEKKEPRLKHMIGCATGVRTFTEGKYEFDIILIESKEGYRLIWRTHK